MARRSARGARARRERRARAIRQRTLIAGIGTLLLAMGVGVLIGRSGDNVGRPRHAAQVVTVGGGGRPAAARRPRQPQRRRRPAAASERRRQEGRQGQERRRLHGDKASRAASRRGEAAARRRSDVGSQGKGRRLPERQVHRQLLRAMKAQRFLTHVRPRGSAAAQQRRRASRASEPPQRPTRPTGSIDLERRRDQLVARVAELQWDLGGLVYEMAIRNRIQRRGAGQARGRAPGRRRRTERGRTASCAWSRPARPAPARSCGAPHSSGATFCWQCGQPLLEQVSRRASMRR